MKKWILAHLLLTAILGATAYPQLIINEAVCNSTSDWVELYYSAKGREKINISSLYVTMYYGTNETLGTDPITIYSYDRPETPYDDRFIVIHLTEADNIDETDLTGDTNKNGYIDVYCNNYYASLWNSDCVIAIDSDDDPSNGGIIDFIAYSNKDKTPNSTIESYINHAQLYGEWQICSANNIQECTVDIGINGLEPYMSISRNNAQDTNSKTDFTVTSFQTPGKPNIAIPNFLNKNLLKVLKKKITIIPYHSIYGKGEIPLFVLQHCNIKLRVFTATGRLVYKSPYYRSIYPGFFSLYWNYYLLKPKLPTGLYIGKIEAVNTSLRISENRLIYIIFSRYN